MKRFHYKIIWILFFGILWPSFLAGASGELPYGILFPERGVKPESGVVVGRLENSKVWISPGVDKTIYYSCLPPKSSAVVSFPAFEVDSAGLPLRDMVFEIYYRDEIQTEEVNTQLVQGNVVIQSRIDAVEKNEYISVGHLRGKNSREWKLSRVFLARTPRTCLRAIDGRFWFRIQMPSQSMKFLPVSYFRLAVTESEEFICLREEDRKTRGLDRMEYTPDPSRAISSDTSSVEVLYYPVNPLELVFPGTVVDRKRLGEPLCCFEIPGQKEPVSFVVQTRQPLGRFSIKVTDLRGEKELIASTDIHIQRVVNNDQRWGWGYCKTYGVCPDYLATAEPLDLSPEKNYQYWLTISIPSQLAGGLYQGKVLVYSGERMVLEIPLSVEVLPIRLGENSVHHFLYHSPAYRHFDKDPLKVYRDMRDHNIVPICYPQGEVVKDSAGSCRADTRDLEKELKILRSLYPEQDILFLGMENYGRVWDLMGGAKVRFQTPCPRFEKAYGEVLLQYAKSCRQYGFEPYFSFVDEPGVDPSLRRILYVCSSVAKSKGLRTWVVAYMEADKQLPLLESEKAAGVNYGRPMSEVLDVLGCCIWTTTPGSLETMKKRKLLPAYYTTFLCTSPFPIYNRFLHGMYTLATDAKFVLAYAYRDSIYDPFDDLDGSEKLIQPMGQNDFLLAYPSWSGDILPTLSYEALREGIEDSCLISTLQEEIEKALAGKEEDKKDQAHKAAKYLEELANRMNRNFLEGYWRKHLNQPDDPMQTAILQDLDPQKGMDYSVMDTIRREICNWILVLQSNKSNIIKNTIYNQESGI